MKKKMLAILLDLSCNSGGSSDALMAIIGMLTGRDFLTGRNRLTGQTMRVIYEIDANFDGVFDEKDREAQYDFNFGVLTTRCAFSCGNLFPIIMREQGAVVIGEPTSGGSCAVQTGIESQGIRYLMSSCQWQLTDSAGESVEGGCPVDLPIEPESIPILDYLFTMKAELDEGIPFYTQYFNDGYLDSLMNNWFGTEQELAPAA